MDSRPKLDFAPGDPFIIYFHVNLVGEDTCHEMQKVIFDRLPQGTNNVIISLSETKYMSSAGVALLIKLLTKFRVAGGELVLCNLTPGVRNLLEITKLSEVFKTASNLDDAQSVFKK